MIAPYVRLLLFFLKLYLFFLLMYRLSIGLMMDTKKKTGKEFV